MKLILSSTVKDFKSDDNINYDTPKNSSNSFGKLIEKFGIKDIINTCILRLLIISFSILLIKLMYNLDTLQPTTYLYFLIPVFLLFLDTIYICIRRKGKDYNW